MKIEEAKEILKDIMANTYAEGKAKAINTVLNELDKKDKVIDMMAEDIAEEFFKNKEEVKEYYFKEVEIPEEN